MYSFRIQKKDLNEVLALMDPRREQEDKDLFVSLCVSYAVSYYEIFRPRVKASERELR